MLWDAGYATLLDYGARNLKKQFKKADRAGARFTLVLGEEEVRADAVTIKDMQSQQQVRIATKDVPSWLKQNS